MASKFKAIIILVFFRLNIGRILDLYFCLFFINFEVFNCRFELGIVQI